MRSSLQLLLIQLIHLCVVVLNVVRVIMIRIVSTDRSDGQTIIRRIAPTHASNAAANAVLILAAAAAPADSAAAAAAAAVAAVTAAVAAAAGAVAYDAISMTRYRETPFDRSATAPADAAAAAGTTAAVLSPLLLLLMLLLLLLLLLLFLQLSLLKTTYLDSVICTWLYRPDTRSFTLAAKSTKNAPQAVRQKFL